ncbi:hypothetical protein C499_13235 [Halogeometricum borinquense DSM 11551]|uniref:Zinc finger FPG/IleRS-type domain-containing protein n=2 Tax=Halogeometricum borinquense TaxID=60847 RepID=E4NUJ2_HALBP|nr:hypothetical protein Hbor_31770 [Halogeometricum borinquense DSM 11551]ELY25452.1 hypothetical protein C499_13235 [Halogeometricum borinquense DSM 11551]RYJ08662.1 hypothetical protein ELS19_19470 [Halogeometricum borinquense]
MDCPRCENSLSTIVIQGGGEAVYCKRCRYADVESEYEPSDTPRETWDDAIRRFKNRHIDAGASPARTEEVNETERTPSEPVKRNEPIAMIPRTKALPAGRSEMTSAISEGDTNSIEERDGQ